MRLMIDTNVILDMIFKRKGCENTLSLFRKIEQEKSVPYITASAVTDLFYIIRKETHDMEQTYQILMNLFKIVRILSVTEYDIKDAFGARWKDFEDCVQYTVAQNNKVSCIITNNKKDYEDSLLVVQTPQEYISATK